jgi:hypothetical protein
MDLGMFLNDVRSSSQWYNLREGGNISKKEVENTWIKIQGAIYWLLGKNYKWIS